MKSIPHEYFHTDCKNGVGPPKCHIVCWVMFLWGRLPPRQKIHGGLGYLYHGGLSFLYHSNSLQGHHNNIDAHMLFLHHSGKCLGGRSSQQHRCGNSASQTLSDLRNGCPLRRRREGALLRKDLINTIYHQTFPQKGSNRLQAVRPGTFRRNFLIRN